LEPWTCGLSCESTDGAAACLPSGSEAEAALQSGARCLPSWNRRSRVRRSRQRGTRPTQNLTVAGQGQVKANVSPCPVRSRLTGSSSRRGRLEPIAPIRRAPNHILPPRRPNRVWLPGPRFHHPPQRRQLPVGRAPPGPSWGSWNISGCSGRKPGTTTTNYRWVFGAPVTTLEFDPWVTSPTGARWTHGNIQPPVMPDNS